MALIDYDKGLKIFMANHDDKPIYSKKGIPEALIPKIAEIKKKDIYSSSSKKKAYNDENRVSEATKYWYRIKEAYHERVEYDEVSDTFIFRHVQS